MDRQLYRKLNALDWTPENYARVIQYKETNILPAILNTEGKRRRFENSFNPFMLTNDHEHVQYTYHHNADENIVLLVLHDAEIQNKLEEIYDDIGVGIGHGQTQFYEIVSSKYLNVTRKQTNEFLREQLGYQLTRKFTMPKHKTKKYYEQNDAWALDLIDMSNVSNFNQNWKFIMSVQDLYTKQCVLRKLHSKNANELRAVWNTFCNNDFKPKLLLVDNGTEFHGLFQQRITQLGIKVLNTKTHTPLPEIENQNGQIRKFISEINAKNRNLIWHTHLGDIQENMNKYNALPRNKWKREEKAEQEQNAEHPVVHAKYAQGDHVRVRQSAFISRVRDKNKQGLMKEMPVKLSVISYTIRHTYAPPHNIANGFYHYTLNYENGNPVIDNGVQKRYRESDLMKVPVNVRGVPLTVQQSHQLNRI